MSFRIMKLSYVCKRVVIVPSFPTWWKMEKSAERDKMFCYLVCLFESRRTKVSPAAVYICLQLLRKTRERSSSATCVSFAVSSKMCTLILSLMHNNPLLNRKATCHFPQDQSIHTEYLSLAGAHLFYKPQRPVLMSIHKCTCTFIGICSYTAFWITTVKELIYRGLIQQAQQILCTECISLFVQTRCVIVHLKSLAVQ